MFHNLQNGKTLNLLTKVNLKVVASVLWGETVMNDVQLLPMASTASPYATVVMITVTLCLDVNVQCQVIYI